MSLDDDARVPQFSDSTCTCKLCDHRVTADCIKSNCNCCTDSNHSMVMDGIEGFASLPSKEVLLGQIAGLLTANTASIVGIFESLIRDIALLAEEVAKKTSGTKE